MTVSRIPLTKAERLARLAARDDDHAYLIDQVHQWADRVPCVTSSTPERWTSGSAEDQEAAAWRCLPCAVLIECNTYIRNHPREVGTWGALTEADRHPTAANEGVGDPSPGARPSLSRSAGHSLYGSEGCGPRERTHPADARQPGADGRTSPESTHTHVRVERPAEPLTDTQEGISA